MSQVAAFSTTVFTFRDSSQLLELSRELHISEDLLIASTLLLVKAENIYRNTGKIHITIERELFL